MSSSSVNRRVAASTAIVMGGILLSRVLGFFREWTVAREVGANGATSAYIAAFTLPDFLNYLVAGASLSVTFIPVFTKYVAEDREEEAWRVFSTVITFMGLLLLALVCAGEVFAPQLAEVIAPGFHGPQRTSMIFLTRLMLPAQFCFILGSILSAVQYAKGRFFMPSLGPVVYNAMIILGGLLLASRIGMTGFAVGVLTGSIVGILLMQVYGALPGQRALHAQSRSQTPRLPHVFCGLQSPSCSRWVCLSWTTSSSATLALTCSPAQLPGWITARR